MTNDEHQRVTDAGLLKARERDIARRGLVGFHKTGRYNEAGAIINETASELKPFEHEIRAMLLTHENSLQVARMTPQFVRACPALVADVVVLGTNPNLPPLPPPRVWNMYRVPYFMEAGEVIRLTVKATYSNGKLLAGTRFLLLRRVPTSLQFTPEDIIYQNPALALNPGVTGINEYVTWFDQDINVIFTYPYPEIRGQTAPQSPIIDRATDYSLYILIEDWATGIPPPAPPARFEMRVEVTAEDRGR